MHWPVHGLGCDMSTALSEDGTPDEDLHDGGMPSGNAQAEGDPSAERAGQGKGKASRSSNWTSAETIAAVARWPLCSLMSRQCRHGGDHQDTTSCWQNSWQL